MECNTKVVAVPLSVPESFYGFDEIAVEYRPHFLYEVSEWYQHQTIAGVTGGPGMQKTERPVRGGMNVLAYPVLRSAVEEGFAYGWRCAHTYGYS
jgi:hypothetical protein